MTLWLPPDQEEISMSVLFVLAASSAHPACCVAGTCVVAALTYLVVRSFFRCE
jgi:hypothetical protein